MIKINQTIIYTVLIFIVLILIIFSNPKENFANSENQTILWENKPVNINIVINNVKQLFSSCSVSNIQLEKEDFTVIDSRKKLIELLPVTKLLDKITYEQIQCFVNKFDSENYLVVSKSISNVPKILKPKNIIIVNDYLYQSSPYGVLKYKIPQLAQFKGLYSLNASVECGILNDFNTFNTTGESIYHIEGKIIQKQGDQFVDIKNNDKYEISNIVMKINSLDASTKSANKIVEKMVDVGGIIELNVSDSKNLKIIDTKTFLPVINTQSILQTPNQPVSQTTGQTQTKLFGFNEGNKSIPTSNDIVSLFEYDGIIYMAEKSQVKPNSLLAQKINNVLEKNKLVIMGVIPHFYYVNNSFNYRLIFILNDDFYIWVNKDVVSDIIDIKKEWNISFNQNVPDMIQCDDLKTILEQMEKASVINKDRASMIINNYKC